MPDHGFVGHRQRWVPHAFYGDTFVTFIYGAAVSLVIDRDMQDNNSVSILGFIIVSYMLVDWVSRVLLPSRLPQEDQGSRDSFIVNLAKAALEAAGLFFLFAVLLWVLSQKAAGPAAIHPKTAFAVFLLCNFLWNLLLLHVMHKLSFVHLLTVSFRGNGLESGEIRHYSKDLDDIVAQLEQQLTDDGSRTGEANSAGNVKTEKRGDAFAAVFRAFPLALRSAAIGGAYRSLLQMFSVHIVICSIAGAVVLLTCSPETACIGLAKADFLTAIGTPPACDVKAWNWDLAKWDWSKAPWVIANCLMLLVAVFLVVPRRWFRETRDGLWAKAMVPFVLHCFGWAAFLALTLWRPANVSIVGVGCLFAIIVPGAIFFFGEVFPRAKAVINVLGAFALIAVLTLTYLSLRAEHLMLYIALQQVAVTLFLCLVAHPEERNNAGGGEGASPEAHPTPRVVYAAPTAAE